MMISDITNSQTMHNLKFWGQLGQCCGLVGKAAACDCQYSVHVPFCVLVIPLLIHLSENCVGKATGDTSHVFVSCHPCMRLGWGWLLALASPNLIILAIWVVSQQLGEYLSLSTFSLSVYLSLSLFLHLSVTLPNKLVFKKILRVISKVWTFLGLTLKLSV